MIYPVIMSNILGISHIFHQGWKPIHPKQKPFPTARTKRSRKHTHANCWSKKFGRWMSPRRGMKSILLYTTETSLAFGRGNSFLKSHEESDSAELKIGVW